MRILVTTQPASGHWNPMVGVCQALRDAGHEVRVATARGFGPAVTRFELDAVPAGLDWLESEAATSFPALARLPLTDQTQTMYFLRHIFIGATARPMVEDLLRLFDTWPADLVMSETYEFGGALAAELTGRPFVMFAVGSRLPPWHFPDLVGSALDQVRTELGLLADPTGERRFRDLCLTPAPRAWLADNGALVDNEHLIRHTTPPIVGTDEVPAWLRARSRERPFVYATLGTVFNRTPGLLQLLIEALADERWEALVTAGAGTPVPRTLPANVHVEPHVPHRAVLAHCDLVVCHAGFNSVMDSLVAGVPLVVLPLAADQPFQAARVLQLGLGSAPHAAMVQTPFGVPAIDPTALTPDMLHATVRDTLEDATTRAAVAAFQGQLLDYAGPDEVVPLVEAARATTSA